MLFLHTVLRKTDETYWKVMVWEIVFAHGPEENRAKPIPKCCFCTRSLGKQTESMRNLNFLQRSLGKQMKRSDICSFSLKIVGKQRWCYSNSIQKFQGALKQREIEKNQESVTYGFLIRNLIRNKNGRLRLIEWISGVLFLTKSILFQNVEKWCFGKPFLLTVLRKTE